MEIPIGLCAKSWNGKNMPFPGVLAWFVRANSFFHLHIDYLLHHFSQNYCKTVQSAFYYNLIGRVTLVHDNKIGFRILLGIDYLFTDYFQDIVFKLVPFKDLLTENEFDLNESIAIRYFSDWPVP